MSDAISKSEKERLAMAAAHAYSAGLSSHWSEPTWPAVIDTILTRLDSMGYTLAKRIPHHGRTDEKQRG